MDCQQLCNFLLENKIDFTRFDHQAVFTCEQAAALLEQVPGKHSKNLFLTDKNQENFYLVSTSVEKRVNLKALAELIGSKKLSFASAQRLQEYLGVEPGSVTLLGLINDLTHKLKVYIDSELWSARTIQCHPLINSSSIVISPDQLKKFFGIINCAYKVIDVPAVS